MAAVGYGALRLQVNQPQNTIFNAKRFLGGSMEDPSTLAYAKSHPFNVVSANSSNYTKVGFKLSQKAEKVKQQYSHGFSFMIFLECSNCHFSRASWYGGS